MKGVDAADLLPGYARVGVAVLPLHHPVDGRCSCGRSECASPGKHPRTRNGAKDATTDIGLIAEWIARWPNANWGGVPPVGVVILDVDPRNHGDESLAELEGRHGPLPPTLTCRTGSGGWHVWLSYNGPARGRLADGIDVKKTGGYVVLPPSLHMAGGTYEWTDTRPAATAPRWVRLKLNPPINRTAAYPADHRTDPSGLVKFVLTAPEGERNSRLYWACIRAHENGFDTTPLVDAAETIGLPRVPAQATADSAAHPPPRKATA